MLVSCPEYEGRCTRRWSAAWLGFAVKAWLVASLFTCTYPRLFERVSFLYHTRSYLLPLIELTCMHGKAIEEYYICNASHSASRQRLALVLEISPCLRLLRAVG